MGLSHSTAGILSVSGCNLSPLAGSSAVTAAGSSIDPTDAGAAAAQLKSGALSKGNEAAASGSVAKGGMGSEHCVLTAAASSSTSSLLLLSPCSILHDLRAAPIAAAPRS